MRCVRKVPDHIFYVIVLINVFQSTLTFSTSVFILKKPGELRAIQTFVSIAMAPTGDHLERSRTFKPHHGNCETHICFLRKAPEMLLKRIPLLQCPYHWRTSIFDMEILSDTIPFVPYCTFVTLLFRDVLHISFLPRDISLQ